MKTLDKKISVSSDQLDTLTTEQRADKFAQVADDDGDDDDDDYNDDGDDGDGDDDDDNGDDDDDKLWQIGFQIYLNALLNTFLINKQSSKIGRRLQLRT